MTRGYYQGHEIHEHRHAGDRWFTIDSFDEPRFVTTEEAAAWIDALHDPAIDLRAMETASPPQGAEARDTGTDPTP